MSTPSSSPVTPVAAAHAGDSLNPYAAPASAPKDSAPADFEQIFYVVAPRKFLLLSILTLGAYWTYWFYRNWALLNRRDKAYWPIPRAIFQIFFTHALFSAVDRELRARQIDYTWSPGALATVFVIANIFNHLSDRILPYDDDSVLVLGVIFVMLVPLTLPLYRGQLAINASQGDPEGDSNSEITAANILWLLLGGAAWLLLMLAVLATVMPLPFLGL